VSFRNGSGPEAAATVLEARKNVGIGNAAPSKPSPENWPAAGTVVVTSTEVYRAEPHKAASGDKAEVELRREKLFEIVEAMKPMTVPQVFYQATVRDIVEKSEAGYTKVQTDLVIAVNRDQIAAWNLPTRPTKSSDSRSRRFGNISVEFDAINPDRLRALVQGTIEWHLPPRQFEVLKAAEASEREIITKLVAGLGS
jgi:hypothetical protein